MKTIGRLTIILAALGGGALVARTSWNHTYTEAERSDRTAQILHQICNRYQDGICGGIEIRFDDGAFGRLVAVTYGLPTEIPDNVRSIRVRLNDGTFRNVCHDQFYSLASYRPDVVYPDGTIGLERQLD